MRKRWFFVVLAFFLAVFSVRAAAAERAMVFTERAKLYSNPGKRSFQLKVVAAAEKGAGAVALAEAKVEDETWYKVKLGDNSVGWVEAKFLRSPAAQAAPSAAEKSPPSPKDQPVVEPAKGGAVRSVALPRGGESAFSKYTLKAPLLDTDIKEDVISIDTTDPLYAPYFQKLTVAIQETTIYPIAAYNAKIEGRVDVRFSLLRTGELAAAKVTNSSGFKLLDEAALDAVQMAAPFEPFPDSIKKESLNVAIDFVFNPVYREEEKKAKPPGEEPAKPLFERKFR